MFVVIYTPGPAWLHGKSVTEQPFFREHGRYMQRLFANGQIIMGGPFLDDQGGLGIIDVTNEAQACEIVAHDPAVLAKVFQPHLHPWHPAFNRYTARSTTGEAAPQVSARDSLLLDDYLPICDGDRREHHATVIDAPPARVYAALWQMTADDLPLFRLVMGIRALPALRSRQGSPSSARQKPLIQAMLTARFARLAEESDRELVVGLIAQPWKPRGGSSHRIESSDDFLAFDEPGYVKAATNFLLTAESGGTRLSTETRIHATDPTARRKFRRYWSVIRPGSGLIRRDWLRAIKRRAEKGTKDDRRRG